MTIKIERPNILIVEGKEEELFFEALIKHIGIENIQIFPIGGKEKLRENLKALKNTPNFSNVLSLGVVRDANADPNAALQSICDALRAVDLPVPEHVMVPVGHNPQVTIMILPKEDTHGMLEDICLWAVEKDSAMPCVEKYFQCLQQQGLSPPRNISKAKVQVFLASKMEAGKRLGEAAQAGYWPWDDNAFEQVKNFLRQISLQRNI